MPSLISGFDSDNLFRSQPFHNNSTISYRITIKPQVKKRIKSIIIFGIFSAEYRDLIKFMEIRSEYHGFEPYPDAVIQKKRQTSNKSIIGARMAGHFFRCLFCGAIDTYFNIPWEDISEKGLCVLFL